MSTVCTIHCIPCSDTQSDVSRYLPINPQPIDVTKLKRKKNEQKYILIILKYLKVIVKLYIKILFLNRNIKAIFKIACFSIIDYYHLLVFGSIDYTITLTQWLSFHGSYLLQNAESIIGGT